MTMKASVQKFQPKVAHFYKYYGLRTTSQRTCIHVEPVKSKITKATEKIVQSTSTLMSLIVFLTLLTAVQR